MPWSELPSPAPPRSPSRAAPLLRWLPALALVALLWLLGAHELAVLVLVASTVVTVAAAASPRFAALLERAVHAVGRWVGTAVGAVLQGLVYVVIVLPAYAVSRLARRDVLRLPGSGDSTAGWWDRAALGSRLSPTHTFSKERTAGPRTRSEQVAAWAPRVVGLLALLVCADLLLGRVVRDPAPAPTSEPVEEQIAAATADMPWFDDYRSELAALEVEPEPFVLTEPVDHEGEYVNVTDGVRRTYTPDDAGPDSPRVAVFGGSVAWGEGQRDLHTIPSELARLAEADGIEVVVENRAQRGDTNFAEVLRFERLLADGDPPDVAVFLDGPDDVAVQAQRTTGHPSHYGLAANTAAIEAEVDDRSLWERYSDTSLLSAITRRAQGLFGAAPAAAQEVQEGPGTAEEVAGAAVEVHGRGMAMAELLADGAEVPVRAFWLPTADAAREGSAYALATDLLPEAIGDLTSSVDDADGPVYLNGVHLTEAGAAQVAAALYEALRPDLEALEAGR